MKLDKIIYQVDSVIKDRTYTYNDSREIICLPGEDMEMALRSSIRNRRNGMMISPKYEIKVIQYHKIGYSS